MEPESLLRRPAPPAPKAESGDFGQTLRRALEQFAEHVADDAEAIATVCGVVQPLLPTYGERVPVEQWRDSHGVATQRYLESGGQEERGLRIVDGMGHVLSEPRTAREDERWLLNAEARRHQIHLTHATGLALLAWKPGGMFSQGRVVLDHWRAAVRPLTARELLANYPVEAFLQGLQESLTRRLERSRHWADFIRRLNQEFDQLLEND
jgi:hypothetical protein